MKYYSTNNKSTQATLQEVVVKGLASDRGLYMPEVILWLIACSSNGLSRVPSGVPT